MARSLEQRVRRLERRHAAAGSFAASGDVPIEQWPDGLLKEVLGSHGLDEFVRALSIENLEALIEGLGNDPEET
jgi:hypothetical protein